MEESWIQSSDSQLIGACLNGDEKAWQALVGRYKRLVYSVPLRWGLPPEDSVDIFQGVWFDCFRQLSSLRDVERLQPWLVRVAVRKCHRLSTDRRSRVEDPIDDSEMEDVSGIEDPTAFFSQLDRDQTIRTALDKLTRRCREVIYSLFFEDPRPSYQTIASRLGLSENSIGFTRERCLVSLKKILDDLGYER
jgi:RNA polymerase sigma factor (sigma-70 family)